MRDSSAQQLSAGDRSILMRPCRSSESATRGATYQRFAHPAGAARPPESVVSSGAIRVRNLQGSRRRSEHPRTSPVELVSRPKVAPGQDAWTTGHFGIRAFSGHQRERSSDTSSPGTRSPSRHRGPIYRGRPVCTRVCTVRLHGTSARVPTKVFTAVFRGFASGIFSRCGKARAITYRQELQARTHRNAADEPCHAPRSTTRKDNDHVRRRNNEYGPAVGGVGGRGRAPSRHLPCSRLRTRSARRACAHSVGEAGRCPDSSDRTAHRERDSIVTLPSRCRWARARAANAGRGSRRHCQCKFVQLFGEGSSPVGGRSNGSGCAREQSAC